MIMYKGLPITDKRDIVNAARAFDDLFGDCIEDFLQDQTEAAQEDHIEALYLEETNIINFLTQKLSAEDLEEVKKLMGTIA